MNIINFEISFFQYTIAGELSKKRENIEKITNLFDSASDIGDGNEQSFIANVVKIFCEEYGNDENIVSKMAQIIISAHIKKNTECLEEETIDIDVAKLLEDFGVDPVKFAESMNIFILRPDMIEEYDISDYDNLPKEIKSLLDTAKLSDGMVAEYDPTSGEFRAVTEDEIESNPELKKGTEIAKATIEQKIAKKLH
ncbi:hypothetical protein F7U66_00495 [Vibrio parahaemolyticus]|nr:hypothetical protein [Vibrio parahaemolyticus]